MLIVLIFRYSWIYDFAVLLAEHILLSNQISDHIELFKVRLDRVVPYGERIYCQCKRIPK
jgi:hypothetical protein